MAETAYKLGYDYTKRIKYNVSFTYSYQMFQPTISGPNYVLSNDSVTFNLTFTDMIIEGITATNCTIEFDSANNTFTITNPTADVVVNIEAHGIPC